MKKMYILLCTAVLYILPALSQIESHLAFYNIPINGHINDFVRELKKRGFSGEETIFDYGVKLSGQTANLESEIYVYYLPKSKTVFKIITYLTTRKSWHVLKNDYNSCKELHRYEYGKPSVYEFFDEPFYDGDGFEMQGVKEDKCTYLSYWKTNEGIVQVEISNLAKVRCIYEDRMNGLKAEHERKVTGRKDF